MQYLRLLLFPFSMIYGLIIRTRNKAFDIGVLKSTKFDLPVISIGNLAVGGAGKSPMAEYLIRLLKDQYKVAVLSRGYRRNTRGFKLVGINNSAAEVGDEPMQFKQKFPDITVAVSEKRVLGIEKLKDSNDVLILDDAFQHRAVQPGLSLLLFDYTRLSELFLPLPAGNFREPFENRKRADVIVVTKAPERLIEEERETVLRRIKPFNDQMVIFSYLDYGDLMALNSGEKLPLSSLRNSLSIYLLTGIANPLPLVERLRRITEGVFHHDYPDHHPFTKKNIAKLVQEFEADPSKDKVIITTEKDAQRLKIPQIQELLAGLPVYYLPVEAKIHPSDVKKFNNLILIYVAGHLQHNGIY